MLMAACFLQQNNIIGSVQLVSITWNRYHETYILHFQNFNLTINVFDFVYVSFEEIVTMNITWDINVLE